MLLKALIYITAARIGLWVLPFRTLCFFLERGISEASMPEQPDKQLTGKIAWAVGAMSRYVPKATCLTQAIATQTLLKRLRQPASIRIGVAKDEMGKLEAHAWVESQGRIIIGERENLSQYTLLISSGEKNRVL